MVFFLCVSFYGVTMFVIFVTYNKNSILFLHSSKIRPHAPPFFSLFIMCLERYSMTSSKKPNIVEGSEIYIHRHLSFIILNEKKNNELLLLFFSFLDRSFHQWTFSNHFIKIQLYENISIPINFM